MIIQDAVFFDLQKVGAIDISISSTWLIIKSSSFKNCSNIDDCGGAIRISATSSTIQINDCCGTSCKTDYTYGNVKDYGQFLFISGSKETADINRIATLLCPDKLENFNRHGSISTSGNMKFVLKNINTTKSNCIMGPSYCGYSISNVNVMYVMAVECHSNVNSQKILSAVTMYSSSSFVANFLNINFVNCSSKYEMVENQDGTYNYCFLLNCVNYNLNSFGSLTNGVVEEVDTYGMKYFCNNAYTQKSIVTMLPNALLQVMSCVIIEQNSKI